MMRQRLRRRAARISRDWGSTNPPGPDARARDPSLDCGLGDWSILITDDDRVRQLNADYRDKDKTTDVLSFPQGESLPGVSEVLLGDVVISAEQAQRQAPDQDLEAEIVRLMVHGYCHLRGHDHLNDNQRKKMARVEQALLDRFGLEAGLVARSL
jgi:probable rRNA maturation factor